MRANSDETRYPALEHPPQTFLLGDVGNELHHALLDMRAHDSRLDDVDGTAYRRGHEASEERGRKVRRQVILEGRVGQQHALEAVVGCELADGHQHGARRVGPYAFPEARDTFFASHAHHAVQGVLVVSPFLGRQGRVVLHSNVQNVAGVAGKATQETGYGGHADEGQEGGLRVRGGKTVFEGFVDAEAGHRVGYLAELGGGELRGVSGGHGRWALECVRRGTNRLCRRSLQCARTFATCSASRRWRLVFAAGPEVVSSTPCFSVLVAAYLDCATVSTSQWSETASAYRDPAGA